MTAVAETAGSRIETVFGNKRVIIADLTSVDDSETWDSLLTTVESWSFVPATAVAIGGTVSGGVITIKVAAGTLAGKMTAVGI